MAKKRPLISGSLFSTTPKQVSWFSFVFVQVAFKSQLGWLAIGIPTSTRCWIDGKLSVTWCIIVRITWQRFWFQVSMGREQDFQDWRGTSYMQWCVWYPGVYAQTRSLLEKGCFPGRYITLVALVPPLYHWCLRFLGATNEVPVSLQINLRTKGAVDLTSVDVP